jgi:sortase A
VTAAEPRVQPAGSRGRGGLLRRARHRGGLERRAPRRALPRGARRRGRVRSSAGKRPRERLAERKLMPWTPRRIGVVGGVWLVVTVICAGLVCYGLGPLTESRQQRAMLTEMRGEIGRAVGAQNSLFGDRRQPTRAPEVGDPVAIVQIPRLKLQQVIVEGGDSRRTQAGPGHVPGTAGPGQPGNSAVVARRYGFGAPFHRLPSLRAGEDIIISTTQGLSLYQVRSVERRRNLARGDVYAASTDDRLTLVTSASVAPWEGRRAVVVVATKSGLPFPAAPQGGRSHLEDGRSGDPSAVALIVLYAVTFAGTVVAAVLLYRRWLSISTYLLTTPIMIALIVLAAEAATRLLPAWT